MPGMVDVSGGWNGIVFRAREDSSSNHVTPHSISTPNGHILLKNNATPPGSEMGDTPMVSFLNLLKRLGLMSVGISAADAFMYNPSVWRFGQCRAKGRKAWRVSGPVSLLNSCSGDGDDSRGGDVGRGMGIGIEDVRWMGSQAKTSSSNEGHFEASSSILDWVI